MLLPPPPAPGQKLSTNDAMAVVGNIDGRVLASWQVATAFRDRANNNLNLFLGNHFTAAEQPGEVRITANRIQNAVIAVAAVQNREPPAPRFIGRETDEPALAYLNTVADLEDTAALRMLLQGGKDPLTGQAVPPIDPATWQKSQGPDGKTIYPRALNAQELARVQTLISRSDLIRRQMQSTAMPPEQQQALMQQTVPAELLTRVNDRTTAEAIQDAADILWDKGQGRQALIENSLLNTTNGWQDMSFEFDDDAQAPLFRNPEFMLVHIDPVARDVATANWVAMDQYIPVELALAKYGDDPELAQAITDHATEGSLPAIGANGLDVPSVFQQTQFRESMVGLRTAWVRHQPYALTLDEALAAGKVEKRQGPAPQGLLGRIGEALAGAAAAVGHAVGLGSGDAPTEDDDLVPAHDLPEAPEETGSVDVAPTAPMVDRYYLGGKDITAAVTKGAFGTIKGWPTRRAIRQLRIIANQLVDDRECEFVDIPLARNFNIKYPYRPYGLGEPERLEGLQRAINALLSDFATFSRHNAFPASYASADVFEMNPELAEKRHVEPGRLWKVPAASAEEFKAKFGVILPPRMSDDSWKLVTLLLDLIDKESNQTEVMQGRASASWSGDAIGKLQSAAEGTIGFKSIHAEFMLRHHFNLLLGVIQTRMTPETLHAMVGKYPIQVWYAFHERAKRMTIDITVEITSGSGANKEREKQTAMAAFNAKLLSRRTTLQRMREDPKVEEANFAEEARDAQAGQTPSQPAGMAPQSGQPTSPQVAPAEPQNLPMPAAVAGVVPTAP